MSARTILTALSAGRVFFGLVMLVAPRFIGERWLGAGGARPESAALMRVAGVRDAAIGVGGLLAARSETDPRPWLAGCAVADVTDAYATLTAKGVPASNKAPSIAVALGAAGAGVAGLLLAED
jgi:hypothetical protein